MTTNPGKVSESLFSSFTTEITLSRAAKCFRLCYNMLFVYVLEWLHLDFLKQEKTFGLCRDKSWCTHPRINIWPASGLLFNWCFKNTQNLLAA